MKKFLNFQSSKIKKAVRILWILFLSFFIVFPAYIYSVSVDLFGLFGGMPSLTVLENPENDLSSEIVTADGVSLGRYYRYNRSQVKFEDLSEELVKTLISSEDLRFYTHSGLDLRAYLRVIKGVLTLNLDGGGSTITQQLAKNLYTQNVEYGLDGSIAKLGSLVRRVVQKTKEWIISVYLERNFTKEEIMTMYLNTAEFSSNSYGIKVAAETYFNTTPDSLDYTESAILVGMLQAPTRFNPARNPDNAFRKKQQVLYDVYKNGHIDQVTYDSLKNTPIDMSDYKVESHNSGYATYFLRSVLRQDLMNWCKENGYDLFDDGLKITVTIDSRMQEYAELAVKEHMAELQEIFFEKWKGKEPWRMDNWKVVPEFIEKRFRQTQYYRDLVARFGKGADSIETVINQPKPMKVFTWEGEVDTVMSTMDSMRYYKHFLHTGFMAMEPQTGQVKAWVGGINYKYFQYDHVKQGKRQPGSTFKTFVYGLAMANEFSPCLEKTDVSPSIELPDGTIYRAQNAEGGYGTGEKLTIRQAMAQSINSITLQLFNEFGAQNVVDFAKQLGIKSNLDAVPSLALGTSDVSLFELLGSYGAFVNKGMFIEPYYIKRIEDKYGNIVYNSIPETREAISEEVAYKILYMLRGGVEEQGGTSVGLSPELKVGNQIGGKTGTTNNASDGWYVGVTKDLVAGAWVGGEERTIHFRSWADGQGGKTARPIWDKFMRQIYKDEELGYEKGPFTTPLNGLEIELDCDAYATAPSDSNATETWNPDNIE